MALTYEQQRQAVAGIKHDPETLPAIARAIEAAATAPLLESIAALTAQVEQAAQPVAWLVTGPYEKRAFDMQSFAEAHCRGLNTGFGEDVYKVSNLVLQSSELHEKCTDERMCTACYSGQGQCKTQAAQPVAVGRFTKFNGEWRESSCGIPLYTAPPKAVPLTEAQEDWALAIPDKRGARTVILTNDMIEDILRAASNLNPNLWAVTLPKRRSDARLIETAVIRRLGKLGLIDISKLHNRTNP